MSTNDMRLAERASRLAMTILKELVAERALYSRDEFNMLVSVFRQTCEEAGADPQTVLMTASHALCAEQPGFQQRLECRASAVNSLQLH